MKDDLGNRMKEYEGVEAKRKLDPSLPVIVRVDGKGFSKFTKGFKKPFDARLSSAMAETCRTMVENTGATLGYVQSDEITLVFDAVEEHQTPYLGGRVSKLSTEMASLATSAFIRALSSLVPLNDFIHKLPRFDGRAWNVPSEGEVVNTVLWRVLDARKNGISCAYRWMIGPNKDGLSGAHMIAALMFERAIDYNTFFSSYERLGSFFIPVKRPHVLPDDVWDRIPEGKKPADRTVYRKSVEELDPSKFLDLHFSKKKEYIFND